MALKNEDNPQLKQGYIYAVRLLAASKKSEGELLRRLSKKGYPEDTAKQVIIKLKNQGILDDQKLARETVQWAIQTKKYGRNRISFELKKKGVPTTKIVKELEHYPKALERETALSLAEERWVKLKKVAYQKRKKRLYDFLVNRGFDFEMSREIVGQMQNESDENF